MFFKLDSFAILGIEAFPVSVEVHISNGLPSFTIVGLPDKAVNESRLRVRAAILNSDFKFPMKRIIVNLSPADLKKEGAFYDLPITLAILYVSNQVADFKDFFFNDCCFTGELSLDGKLNPVRGILPMVQKAKELDKKYFFIPYKNAQQASMIKNLKIIAARDLKETIKYFSDVEKVSPQYLQNILNSNDPEVKKNKSYYQTDFSEIRGQIKAKRAMEVAVNGMHNIMLIGPPGAGKTMLAQRINTIMPELTHDESIELTKIYSLYKKNIETLIQLRPFRSPHHTISRISLIGGGIIPKPGEITLAHRGVLFLDEFSHFPKNIIEDLRQPLENKEIVISRNNHTVYFPCSFMLVLAINPCGCGYMGDDTKKCVCTQREIKNFWNNISGPILDRIDMKISIPRLKDDDLLKDVDCEGSKEIRKRIIECNFFQKNRNTDKKFIYNSELSFKALEGWIKKNKTIENLIPVVIKKYGLSARGVVSTLRISRTIADMEKSDSIDKDHFLEALNYRVHNCYEGKI